MESKKIIVRPPDTKSIILPGVVTLPDGKKQLALGSGYITSLISAGGMAIVYEIWNPELEVKRAVKLLKPDHTAESEDRFNTEMKISAKLHHPNIVEIYSVGKWNSQLPFIEMELIDGITLEKIITDSGSLSAEVCTAIGILVGRALNYAHNQGYMIYGTQYQGVIHRDLKPGNIMIANDGAVKLMDFGIAKPMSASIHTIEGTVMGTMQYLAPEQLDNKDVDARADLYSLGVVLYEVLTGTKAFPEQNIGKLVTDKINNNFVPLTEYSAKTPASLINLIHRLIRCEKEKRIQNVRDYLDMVCKIHKTLTEKSPEQVIEAFMKSDRSAKQMVLLRKRKSVLPVIVWAVTVLGFLGIFGFAAYQTKPELVVSLYKSLQTKLYSLSHKEVASAKPIATRVDSVLSIQPVKPVPKPQESPFDEFAEVEKKKNVKQEIPETRPLVQQRKQVVQPEAKPVPVEPPQVQQAPVATSLSGQDLVGILKKQYKSAAIIDMFYGEVDASHFSNARQLYSMIPADEIGAKKAKLYYMRTLKGNSDENGLRMFFAKNDIYDGEYYLEKARFYTSGNDFINANEYLRRASKTPCQYLSKQNYLELLSYTKAQSASAIYEQTKIEDARKEALDAWAEVKTIFASTPDHPFSHKADSEIKKLSSASK